MAEALDQRAIEVLLEMVGGDSEFVDELVDAWLADTPGQLQAMRDAVAAGDAAALVRPAHTVKGSAASVGAAAVAASSGALEEQARAGTLDGADAKLGEVADAFDAAVLALAAARERRWAAP
jgi:two-component system, sensor histidine kinase and response regulator